MTTIELSEAATKRIKAFLGTDDPAVLARIVESLVLRPETALRTHDD